MARVHLISADGTWTPFGVAKYWRPAVPGISLHFIFHLLAMFLCPTVQALCASSHAALPECIR